MADLTALVAEALPCVEVAWKPTDDDDGRAQHDSCGGKFGLCDVCRVRPAVEALVRKAVEEAVAAEREWFRAAVANVRIHVGCVLDSHVCREGHGDDCGDRKCLAAALAALDAAKETR